MNILAMILGYSVMAAGALVFVLCLVRRHDTERLKRYVASEQVEREKQTGETQ